MEVTVTVILDAGIFNCHTINNHHFFAFDDGLYDNLKINALFKNCKLIGGSTSLLVTFFLTTHYHHCRHLTMGKCE